MSYLQPVNQKGFKYSHIVGTGGIGSGMFFKLDGNHTMGRNESRLGDLVPFKDYCKLHIIFHYIAVMLGAREKSGFELYPIGRVGKDEPGKRLIDEMANVGMNMKNVTVINDSSTLFSVCFQYPDNTGGNITTGNSSSSRVSAQDILSFYKEFKGEGKTEMVLAAPEVPLETRIKLLEIGRVRGSFNVASVLSSEIEEFKINGGFERVDLLAINIDEARAIAEIKDESCSTKVVIDECVKTLTAINPKMFIVMTDGPHGSYAYKDNCLEFTPILDTPVIGTAGAGDTFLAGTVAGLCCGLPFLKGKSDSLFSESPVSSAVELGTMLAALAVTSPDAIHQTADSSLLLQLAKDKGVVFGSEFAKLFS